MADTIAAPAVAPAPAPQADPLDKSTESAADMLNWTDKEMEANIPGLKIETEDDGEPAADAILEPITPADQLTQKPQEGKLTAAEKPAAAAPVPVPDTPAPEPEPAPTPEPARQPETKFTLADKDGEIEAPDLTVTYQANGKLRENVPFDHVVRMAQRGEYDVEREQRVMQSQQLVAQKDQEITARDQKLAQYDRWFDQILGDEGFRQRALENYQEANTPEAKLAEAQQELRDRDARQQRDYENQQDAAFVETQVTPRVTQLIKQYESTVPFEEIMGRFNMLIAPLMDRGLVGRQNLPTVKHLVDTDLAHWVEQLHNTRLLDRKKTTDTVAAEQTKTTLAKRQLARAQQPSPVGVPAAPKSTEFESAEQWFERTLPHPTPTP